MKTIFVPGDFAFYDTFSGLIPCKVLAIQDNPALPSNMKGATSDCRITFKLTADRGAYRRGEVLESDALKVIPRPFISRKGYTPRILGGYRWRDLMGEAESRMETRSGNAPELCDNARPAWSL